MSFFISNYKYFLFFVLCISSLVAIFFSHKFFYQKIYDLSEGVFSGTIQIWSDIEESGYNKKFFAKDVVTGRIYKTTAPSRFDFRFGNCIDVSGRVSNPKNKESVEVLYNFPYQKYLAKDGVFQLLQVREVDETIGSCPALSAYQSLRSFFMKQKKRFTDMILEEYYQPYSGLVAGVLIAGKGLLSKEVLDMFKRVSLSHVVVLSGSNVSLILACVKTITDKIFRRKKFLQKICIGVFVWIFMLLVGGGAPIYRSVTSTFCGLFLFTQKTSQVYALTISILILTTISPFQTLYDPSFHLTCCATFGLILFSKFFKYKIQFSVLHFLPTWLIEISAITLATQVFVFPYIVYMSGTFSTVFLFSNILVLPLIPVVMFFGFVTVLFKVSGFLFFKKICVTLNILVLKIIFYVVEKMSIFPYSYIYMKTSTSVIVLVLYFSVLVFFIRIASQRPPS